jgi:hypothetical protein
MQPRALIEAAAVVEQVIAVEQRCVDRQMHSPSKPELPIHASDAVSGGGEARTTS